MRTRNELMRIGIVGSGKEGSALALRFGSRGHKIYLSDISRTRAEERASELNKRLQGAEEASEILGVGNSVAIKEAEVVFLSIPYSIESKVGKAIPVKTLLEEHHSILDDKVLVDIIVPSKHHTPMIVDEEDLAFYRTKFGIGKTPSVTEEIYLFTHRRFDTKLRVVGAFKTISYLRIANIQKDLTDEILIWGFEERDKKVIIDLCKGINRNAEARVYEVSQIFWRSIEGVCEYIREQTATGNKIMALNFSYET